MLVTSARMGMGNNIKHLRAAKGWSHDRLGALAETSDQTIEMLEKRDSTRSKYTPVIAAAFGISLESLLSASLDSKAAAEKLLTSMAAGAAKTAMVWPFEKIDEGKVRALSERQRVKFEAAVLIAAAQAGVDVAQEGKSMATAA